MSNLRASGLLLLLLAACLPQSALQAQLTAITNAAGITMTVDAQDSDPVLRITVPDGPLAARSFKILMPEHVSLRRHGQTEAEHLYLYRPGTAPVAPHWTESANTLAYTADFGQIHFVAEAILADDGITFRYSFTNHSTVDYDMITAITDPRFRHVFYDPRLERTYVHRDGGFSLLAAETPERLTLPLTSWFPVRYLAQYTAPIPVERVQVRDGGITFRFAAQPVDQPFIATLSEDHRWVAASFSRDPGNVWSNPELTCQHVDLEVPLSHDGEAHTAVKILIFEGTLDDVLRKVIEQRDLLR